MNCLSTMAFENPNNDIIMFGGIIFWVLVGIFLLIEQISISRKGFSFATFVFVAFLVIMGVLMKKTASAHSVIENWRILTLILTGFIVSGVICGIIKWWMYASKKSRIYEETREKFYEQLKIDPNTLAKDLPIEKRDSLLRMVGSAYQCEFYERYNGFNWCDVIPKAKDYKGEIIGWMCWWPLVLIDTFLRDIVKDIFEALYRSLAKFLQSIANKCFNKHAADFPEPIKWEKVNKNQ